MKKVFLSDGANALINGLESGYILYNALRWPDVDVNMGYRSPAYDFEKDLHKAGVTVPFKLFHEYNVPGGGKIGLEYMHRVQRLMCIMSIDAEYIRNTDSFFCDLVSQLYKIYGEELGDIKKAQFLDNIKKIDAPAEQEIQDLINVLPQLQSDTYKEIVSEVEALKSINPELRDINVDANDLSSLLQFLEDVAFGWAPEEIDYFLHQKVERYKPYYEYLYSVGISNASTIRPDRLEKIVTAVKQNNKTE